MEDIDFDLQANLSLHECKIILSVLRHYRNQLIDVIGKETFDLVSNVPGLIIYFEKLTGEVVE